ncbi:MAG: protein-disulfide reductase DsbD family protein [Hyphomicrobium sp.]|nr:protein-disulfide reductase DsbD family protein [Hyphomicrobium sp.]
MRTSNVAFAIYGLFLLALTPAGAAALESAWLEGHENRVRLSAAGLSTADGIRPFAFIEIEMSPGWKTYWRNPGDAGGIPPVFDLSRSVNVAKAEVLMPVPKVLSDRAGDVIGYKEHVIIPIGLEPADPAKAMVLDLVASIGICEKLCVPVEAALQLDIPAGVLPEPTPDLAAAVEAVPRPLDNVKAGDPQDAQTRVTGEAGAPALEITARFPGDAKAAAVFLDAPGGLYLPLPKASGTDGDGRLRFVADLSRDVDLPAIKAQPITVTLKGETGHSTYSFKID